MQNKQNQVPPKKPGVEGKDSSNTSSASACNLPSYKSFSNKDDSCVNFQRDNVQMKFCRNVSEEKTGGWTDISDTAITETLEDWF